MKKYDIKEQLEALGYDQTCRCSFRRNLEGKIVLAVNIVCKKHNDLQKLTKMLQRAHAGEWAAYLAYEGHQKSVRDPEIKEAIRKIQLEEWEHVCMTWAMLRELGSEPDPWLDALFMVVGVVASFLSRITGYFMPMKGALLMEKVGSQKYSEIALEAREKRIFPMYIALMKMREVEKAHEEFFKTCLKRTKESGQQNQN